MTDVIRVDNLQKSFRTPLRRKQVHVLQGVSFTVERGEVFGFLGPNGAGKTTTIRILMGLIAATGGQASLFGEPVPSRAARARLGFLPESPYFYDYLTVSELLDLTGRLFGIEHREIRRRAERLIDRVGLARAKNTPLKKYSKGMLQRAGIAQALINDPELVVLDEPTSGLDPVGRKEVRDIILSLREQGKTVFFSSHILVDVETISDRIGIVVGGRMRDVGSVSELVGETLRDTAVTLRLPEGGEDEAEEAIAAVDALGQGARAERRGPELTVTLDADADVDAFLARARERGARVRTVTPRYDSLEDLFLRHARSVPSSEDGKEVAA
ncbi:MAG TPA: ABC transporter ATP-binding protein [Haliangium sp.]|nr:ABC transporter ATP-binding protein [Haliangium sp.]